jgi:copper(I)-binding protein
MYTQKVAWVGLNAGKAISLESGSDIHVMLALYSGFGQVVVANEILDGADVVIQLFRERQRTANQT